MVALIASTLKGFPGSIVNTDAIDTTGADLIVLAFGWYWPNGHPPVVVDSRGNTWTALTAYTNAVDYAVQLFYCPGPAVGAGHTFSRSDAAAFSWVGVMAFSGVAAGSSVIQNGAASSSIVTQPGSVTPARDNSLLVTAVATHGAGHSVNLGFTAQSTDVLGGSHIGGGCGYLIQGAAAAVNPTWAWTPAGANYSMLTVAAFVPPPASTSYFLLGSSAGTIALQT